MVDKDFVLSRLDIAGFYQTYVPSMKIKSGGESIGKCPFHGDKHESLSVNVETGLWNCHAGCGGGSVFDFYGKIHGVEFGEAVMRIAEYNNISPEPARKSVVVATYDYTDKDGKLLFQVLRYDPKNFRQRRPDGNGGWIYKLDTVEPVLYHLPEVVKSNVVVVVEGEKDVETLRGIGITATTSPRGAAAWQDRYANDLAGKKVAILPDNDEPGRKFAKKIAHSLFGKATIVKIISLPGLPEKGDVTDWMKSGGTKEKLFDIIKTSPEWAGDLTPEQERVEQLRNYKGEDEVITSWDMIDILHEKENSEEEFSFLSGVPKLDNLLGGFYGGELTVISGKTKCGKTLLAQTFTRNIDKYDIRPLWLTYEVRIKQFLKQFGESVPAFLVPKTLKQNDIVWLENRVFESILKFKSKAVFIDNTHNILNLAGENLTHRVDEFVKRIKEIAVNYNIHVFLLHHIIKSDVCRVEDLNSNLLRDSSMIAQTADNVMFVFRDEMGAWLKVTENRRNGVFNKSVRLQKVGYFFEEVSEVEVMGDNPKSKRSFRRDVDD